MTRLTERLIRTCKTADRCGLVPARWHAATVRLRAGLSPRHSAGEQHRTMNEQEIYEKYGSSEFKARVQRECAEYNCPNLVSAPNDDYCTSHKQTGKDHVEVMQIIQESDVESGDRVEYDGHEWRAEWGPNYSVHLKRLDPDDPTQNIIKMGVDVREVTPVTRGEDRAAITDQ